MSTPRQYSYDLSVKSDVSDELINVYVLRPVAGFLVRFLYYTPNHTKPSYYCCNCIRIHCGGALLRRQSNRHPMRWSVPYA